MPDETPALFTQGISKPRKFQFLARVRGVSHGISQKAALDSFKRRLANSELEVIPEQAWKEAMTTTAMVVEDIFVHEIGQDFEEKLNKALI